MPRRLPDTLQPANDAFRSKPCALGSPVQDLEGEVQEFFVRTAQLLGLPRSLGEIYGLLYLSPKPLSMDQIVARLEMSVGSASQGLRQLRGFRAVKAVCIPGKRKDFYIAEMEFRKLAAGFLNEEIRPSLESGQERIERMKVLLPQVQEDAQKRHLEGQVLHLDRLHTDIVRALLFLPPGGKEMAQ